MTLRLSLVIDGDAAGAKRAAGETSSALEGVQRSAGVSSTAIKSATDANVTSLARLRTEMDRTGAAAAAGSVRFKSLMQGINDSRGLASIGGGDRGADIAAYGAELDRLRAKFNPLFAAGQQYKATLNEIRDAGRLGALSQTEMADAIQRTKSAFAAHVASLNGGVTANNNVAGSTRQARAEMINLSRQMQDVFVGVTSGQSPFLILTQQGSQIADVFASSERSVGSFVKQAISGFVGLLNPVTLVTTAVLAIGIAGVASAVQYGAAQRQIEVGLTGIGRAAGVARSDINRIAQDSASTFGLSVSEARGFATALASTGKIGKDNIAPIVQLGRDVAVAYGEDATAAAKRLADAFSDPAKGADELNQRLGFLDAATQRHIQSLVAQNRAYEAQAVLQAGVKRGLEGVSQTVSTSTAFWTAIGNGISNAWNSLGAFASRATGFGFTQGLDEKLDQTRGKIESLQKQLDSLGNGPAITRNPSAIANLQKQLQEAQAEYQKLTAESDRYWQSVSEAQARQRSFAPAAAVRGVLPELDQLQRLRNENALLSSVMIDVQMSADREAEAIKRSGYTFDELSKALSRSTANLKGFKSEAERAGAGLQIQIDAVTARSPGQKGDIAYRQFLNQSGQAPGSADAETAKNAELARTAAIRQASEQIAEAQRQQLLTAKQRVDTANLELGILGRGSVEQERQRALLQAKQLLEQDALRNYGNREAYDRGHLAALQAQIDAEAKIKQTLAEQQLTREVGFERTQIGRSTDEQQIASRLRGLYDDDYQSQMDGAVAQQMRLNQQLQFTHDIGLDTYKGILSDLRQGKLDAEAFGNAGINVLGKISDKLAEMVFNNLWSAAFPGGGGGLLGLLGLGGTGGAGSVVNAGGMGWWDEGGFTGNGDRKKVAGVVHGREFVINADATAKHLPLLQAINDNKFPGYEAGGFVGPPTVTPLIGGRMGGNAPGAVTGNTIDARTTIHADFRGASSDAIAEISVKLIQLERSIPSTVLATVENALEKTPLRVRG